VTEWHTYSKHAENCPLYLSRRDMILSDLAWLQGWAKHYRRRLKPYGGVLPNSIDPMHLRAWGLGVRDGWAQPHDLSTSTNIDHMLSDSLKGEVYDSLDAGINAGQWLRSPLNHQQQDQP
jgi:hypothetical protein